MLVAINTYHILSTFGLGQPTEPPVMVESIQNMFKNSISVIKEHSHRTLTNSAGLAESATQDKP